MITQGSLRYLHMFRQLGFLEHHESLDLLLSS